MPETLLDQILLIVQDWEKENAFPIWPGDTTERKRAFSEWCFHSGFLSPLTEPDGTLAGFIFYWRSDRTDAIDIKRPDGGGRYVVASLCWVRPDLRGSGTFKKLIRKTIRENREKFLGAEKIVFGRRGGAERFFSFPKFYRRVINAKQ